MATTRPDRDTSSMDPVGGLIFAGLVGLAIPEDCEALRSWYEEIQKRPSVSDTLTISDTRME